MSPDDLKKRKFESEFVFLTSRSSGPGGQNVNKVNSKVELRFNIKSTTLFSEPEKALIYIKLKNKINNEGELLIVSQSERTQLLNKNLVIENFYILASKALTIQNKRKSTRPTISSKIKRLEGKRIRGTIKKLRKGSDESV